MTNVVITGANRGIGLALTARFARKSGTHVIAIVRDRASADDLRAIASEPGSSIDTLQAELTDDASIRGVARELHGTSIDVLINNAGVPSRPEYGHITARDLDETFRVNTFAPVLLVQALDTLLNRGGKVVNITSRLGSIAYHGNAATFLTYGMSKAALNMFSAKLAELLRPRDIAVLALHPGWVPTRLGGSTASVPIDRSADGMMRVIEALDMRNTGAYLAYDGKPIAW